MKLCAIILGAGKGSRLSSDTLKPLIKINNRTIIERIVNTFSQFDSINIFIVVKKNSPIIRFMKNQCEFIFQNIPKGTGHAVKCATNIIEKYDQAFISVGDSPLISYLSLSKMMKNHIKNDIDCSFLTSYFPLSYPYGSIMRDKNMNIIKCVEQKDANKEEKRIKERLSSHYLIKSDIIAKYINEIVPNINTDEEYLTDIINILIRKNKKIEGFHVPDYHELIGVNTPLDLIKVKKIINNE